MAERTSTTRTAAPPRQAATRGQPPGRSSLAAPPAAPSGLSAAYDPQADEITLSWDGVAAATGYEVYRSVSGYPKSFSAETVEPTASPAREVVVESDVFFHVRSVGPGGKSAFSTVSLHVVPPVPPPEPPSDLSATLVGSSSATFSWADNSGVETLFRLQRATDSGFSAGLAEITTAADATSGELTGLSVSTTYHVRVRAENSSGESPWSAAVQVTTSATPDPETPPAAPTGPSATVLSSSAIRLDWTDASSDESGFLCQRATDAGFTAGIATVGAAADAVTATFTGLSHSTTYYMRVRAFNAAGDSAWTTAVSDTTSAAVGNGGGPAPSTGLDATVVSPTRVDLTWTGAGGEDGWVVERSENGGTGWHECGRSNAASYSDRSAPADASLLYRVVGHSSGGISQPSGTSSVTTGSPAPASAPSAPYGLEAYAHDSGSAYLRWRMAASGAEDDFEIQVSPAASPGSWVAADVGGSGNTHAPAGYTFARCVGLSAGTGYDFRVRARNTTGESAWSPTAQVSTLGPGAVWSPAGRNPLTLLNPAWRSDWLAAKADYDANPSAPATYAGKFYARFLSGAAADPPLYGSGLVWWAAHHHLDGDPGVPDRVYDRLKEEGQFGTAATVTDAGSATLTQIKVTGLTSTGANAYAGRHLYFESGANRDPGEQAWVISASSYSSGKTTLTLSRDLLAVPADGDGLFVYAPLATNTVRGGFVEAAYLVDLVWGGLSAARRDVMLLWVNCRWADWAMGTGLANYKGNFALTDSDRSSGTYLGLAVWATLSASLGNPRAGDYLSATTAANPTAVPVGGLDATALDLSTARNAVGLYAATARGGEWVESQPQYNRGTVNFCLDGLRCLYDLLGEDRLPELTRAVLGASLALMASYTPDLAYASVWGDRDESPGALPAPHTTTAAAIRGGLLRGYDDRGPFEMAFLRAFWDEAGTFDEPYGPFCLHLDPALEPATLADLPPHTGGPTMGAAVLADRSSADGYHAALYAPGGTGVHHQPLFGLTYLLYRGGERAVRNVEAYNDWNVTPVGTSGVLWAGLSVPHRCFGPVAADAATDSHAYLRASAHGDHYGDLSSPYLKPPTALYELTRQVLFVPGAAAVFVDHARCRASSPRALANPERYRSDKSYSGVVSASPAPTAGGFSGVITNPTLSGYVVTFTGGANAGLVRPVQSYSSSGGETAFVLAQPLPQAPAAGDTFTARRGGDYLDVWMAPALFQWVCHAETQPDLESDAVAWQTAGGQFLRADHLLPAGRDRVAYDETSLDNHGVEESELRWQVRVWPDPTPWPSDDTPQFVRFLNVVSAADAEGAVSASLVSGSSGEAVDGALVTRPGGDPQVLALFGAGETTPVLYSGFTASWTAAGDTEVFVAGLDPRKSWTWDAGGGPQSLTVPESGLAKFTAAGSGPKTVTLAGT